MNRYKAPRPDITTLRIAIIILSALLVLAAVMIGSGTGSGL